jgi:rSAM/selenodomain-associated transferase 1
MKRALSPIVSTPPDALLGTLPESLAKSSHRFRQKQNRQSLIIFVRSPRDKQVKSRLAATLGGEFATDFYRLCAEHVIRETGRMLSGVQRYIFYASQEEGRAVRRWLGHRFYFRAQSGGELGDRIEHAFRTVFNHGSEKAVIVATDVPDLTHNIMDRALKALDNCDLVIGPSHDGGYYLLGMKRLYSELFKNIPWSTGHVCEETLLRVKARGLFSHILPSLRDIDTEDDLRQWLMSRGHRDRWVDKLAQKWPLWANPQEGTQNACL